MYQEHRCYYWANLGEHYTGLVTLAPGQVSFKKLGLLKDKCERKKKPRVNSLEVQWLGFSVFTVMAWVQSLAKELRSYKQGRATNK